MILVPVKNLSGAKQRLASVLSHAQRTELARAMLQDVLHALSQLRPLPTVALVTGDEFAVNAASHFGFEVIPDRDNPGETAVIEMATQEAEKRGAEFTLVIPADLPLITREEIAALLNAAPAEGSVLAPASDGRGTNAILRRPASLFPCRFGNDSFLPHWAAARATKKPCIVLEDLPGVALDVDRPEDLTQVAAVPGNTRTQRLLRQWKMAARTAG